MQLPKLGLTLAAAAAMLSLPTGATARDRCGPHAHRGPHHRCVTDARGHDRHHRYDRHDRHDHRDHDRR